MPHLDEGRLQEWLDRSRSGISAEETREIEAHLSSCEACAARVEALERSSDRARSILSFGDPDEVPIPDYGEVLERGAVSKDDRTDGPSWRRLAWAATIVLALGVGWMGNELIDGGRVSTEPESATVASAELDEARGVAEAAPEASAAREAPAASEPAPEPAVAEADDASNAPAATRPAEPEADELRDSDDASAVELSSRTDSAAGGAVALGVQRSGSADDERALLSEEALEADIPWTPVDADEAERRLGFRPLTIQDLEVISLGIRDDLEPTRLRVVQRLPDGGEVELVQQSMTVGDAGGDGAAPRDLVLTRRGEVLVEATGPISADSLRALLDRIP